MRKPQNRQMRGRIGEVRLEISWKTSVRVERFQCSPDWSAEGVRLGLGTLLAKQIAGDEARVLGLLSFVFERSFPVSVLNDLKRIESKRRTGAVSKFEAPVTAPIPPLLNMDSARRLHFAVGLMDSGFLLPIDLLEMAGLDTVHVLSLGKYNPDQPRAPGGQSGGGQWTLGDSGGAERPMSVTSGSARNPLDSKVALAGVLAGRAVDHKAEITHCTYSTPLGQFTIEYKLITKCDPTFPYPY